MTHIITDITITKKGRYALFLDGEFAFSVDEQTLFEYHLQNTKEIQTELMEEIQYTSDLRYAKEMAFNLLSYKSYTTKDLQKKLVRYVSSEVAEDAIQKMVELSLVDDLDYAMRYSRDLFRIKKYSLSKIRSELKKKGIEEDYIEEALCQFEEESAEKQISDIILKKYSNKLGDEKGLRSTVNGLLRRGYNYSDIRTVINNLDEDMEYYNY
ncbi:MAG: RecX family transcriptional regulator [Oscillospiraceae bacterium]